MAAPLKFHFLAIFLLLPHSSSQLEYSQSQVLDRIKQQFNYPHELSRWSENQDFCNTEPTQSLTLVCYEGNITQLQFAGNSQQWFPPFSNQFSTSALFSNLASLPSLKVLSLTFLNLTGPLPPEIGGLTSLEMLNLSSNSFTGPIPQEISSMRNLQTLILDYNGITGNLPQWIGSFPELRILSLKNNSLTGSFPNDLSRVETLRALVLSGNNLSGQVPGFNRLLNLQVLDLGSNNLGPKFPSLPTKLVSLIIRGNRFHSAVSDELSACYQLQKLDISLNQLVGTFPPSIFTLPSLTYLDIGGNKFTGKLLQNMSCNTQLMFVNLSGNRLTGDLPDCLHHRVKDRIVTYDGNCLSGIYQNQHPLPFCRSEALAVEISPHKKNEKRSSYGKTVLASSIVGGIAGTFMLIGLALLFVKRGFLKQKQHVNEVPHTRLTVDKVSPVYTLQLLKDARYISKTKMLGTLGIPPYRTYVLDELKEATRNFSSSNLIGEGSYGQVYKGFLTDGTIVCIRSSKLKRKQSMQSCTPQLELIAKLRHGHLVSSMGHCTESCQDDSNVRKIYLVFEYVPNGTLRKYVSDPKSGQKFTWTQRIAAGIGVAKGILFLHTGMVPGIYSNYMKITDILLDSDLQVKVGKYNLPLLTENRRLDEAETSSHGSHFSSMKSCEEKNDVYDFGVILLEMIVGRAIISANDVAISKDKLSVSLTADATARRSIVDPAVHKECSNDSVRTLIELCIRCLSNESSERPSVEDILWNLQFAAQVQDTWIRDANSSTQESPLHATP